MAVASDLRQRQEAPEATQKDTLNQKQRSKFFPRLKWLNNLAHGDRILNQGSVDEPRSALFTNNIWQSWFSIYII